MLGLRGVGLPNPEAAPGMVGWQLLRDQAVRHEPVVRTVDVEVEAVAEVVVVVHADDVAVEETPVGVGGRPYLKGVHGGGVHRAGRRGRLDGRYGARRLDLEEAGGAYPRFDRAVLAEDPVEQVVIVADHGGGAHDEVAARTAVRLLVLVVPPGRVSGFALVDARGPGHRARPALSVRVDRVDVDSVVRAVPAAQQRLGQSACRKLAGVDEVAGVPGEGRVHVGHVDLGELALVHDRARTRVRALAVVDEGHHQSGALVRPQVEAPVLPAHLVAVQVEADARTRLGA